MKDRGSDEILEAVRKVLRGKIAVSGEITAEILDSLSRPLTKRTQGQTSIGKLTGREFEVLRLIGQGREPHEIADVLHLSTKTVDTHRNHIRAKLGLKNNTELVCRAVQWAGDGA